MDSTEGLPEEEEGLMDVTVVSSSIFAPAASARDAMLVVKWYGWTWAVVDGSPIAS